MPAFITPRRAAGVLASSLVLLAAATVPAAADRPDRTPPPGNAGTVKIHRATTSDADRRNEPKVCEFRIVGFGFPADADLDLSIVGHGGPNAGPGTFEGHVGAAQLSPAGDFAIAGPHLGDGMYKLSVDNTTAPGGAKHKVFKVDCGGGDTGGTTGGDTGGTTGGDTGGTTGGDTGGTTGGDTGGTTGGDTGGTTGGDTGGTTGGAGVSPDAPDRVGTEVGGVTVTRPATGAGALPRTGSDLSAPVLAGVGLIGLGTALVLRRRRGISDPKAA